jgi:hypothetical protein
VKHQVNGLGDREARAHAKRGSCLALEQAFPLHRVLFIEVGLLLIRGFDAIGREELRKVIGLGDGGFALICWHKCGGLFDRHKLSNYGFNFFGHVGPLELFSGCFDEPLNLTLDTAPGHFRACRYVRLRPAHIVQVLPELLIEP